MRTICEVVVQDILPTLRAAVAKDLIASYNLNQSEAAKLLGVSQPAISQYLRQLRGRSSFMEDKQIVSEIKELSGKLFSKQISEHELAAKMCAISKVIIDSGFVKGDFHKVDCLLCK